MPDENSTLSVGTTLEIGAVTVGKITALSIDGDTVDINTTDYDIEDRFQTFRSGNSDPGEITATVKFHEDDFPAIYALVGETEDITITFKSGGTWECKGYLKMPTFDFEDAEDDGMVTNELTIKLSGKPDFTAAPS